MDRGYNDYKLFANLTNDHVVFVTRLKDNVVHTNMAKGVRAVDAEKILDLQVLFDFLKEEFNLPSITV